MKLNKKNMVLVSFMLFSLFFGAGNLIFPPFLGANAGKNTFIAMIGFIFTAVLLPVLGVIVVAKFDGLDNLSRLVGKRFGIIFTVLIYLSIGPGLGIPRAASVPFEIAFAPYLGENSKVLGMLIYSIFFFLIALWLCLNPSKLLKRVGNFLTPSLLVLILFVFVSFLFLGNVDVSNASGDYLNIPFLKGFTEGYNTMDAIAALNFGLVIATTIKSFGINDKKDILKNTVKAGIFAGIILIVIYFMLAYLGFCSSGLYDASNGAYILYAIVYKMYGSFGAILLGLIFTLACLTTCVGLINSISLFFSNFFNKISYKKWVLIITFFSFVICNFGLDMIISISIPILNAIYPVSIVLIILGLIHGFIFNNRFIYPLTVFSTSIISILYVLKIDFFNKIIPLYSIGYGWVSVFILMVFISIILDKIYKVRLNNNY